MRARLLMLAMATLLLTCAPTPPTSASLAGLWAWHEPWQSAPPEIVRDSGPQWFANAVVLRFCPDGRFRMATGVLYRQPTSITLGASDGLALYDGRWTTNEVRYRLIDSEIRWSGSDDAMKREAIDRPRLEGATLLFTYERPIDRRRFPMRFIRAEAMEAKLAGRFVECSRPSPAR